MRLNVDCVRDLLLCIEENTGLRKTCYFIDSGLTEAAKYTGDIIPTADYQNTLLECYDNDTLIYHLEYCIHANIIAPVGNTGGYQIVISDLTVDGHQLIDNIRDNTIFKKTKNVLSAFSSVSLSIVGNVASQLLLTRIAQM